MRKKLLLILLCLPFFGFGQCISGDCENGQGTMTYSDGSKYVGEFKDSKRHGQGTYTHQNFKMAKLNKILRNKPNNEANKYVGEWKNDSMNGQGTYTYGISKDNKKYTSQYVGEFM
ncbi:MAG: peptidase C14, partial [Candidatus Marinimicrobia bacterium]|nr:peptidase C14 [Candidatus Neomarinimicrobiota bacterium]